MEHTRLFPEQGTALSTRELDALLRDVQSTEGEAARLWGSDEEDGLSDGGVIAPFPVARSDATRLFPEHFLIGALMLGSFVSGALALFH